MSTIFKNNIFVNAEEHLRFSTSRWRFNLMPLCRGFALQCFTSYLHHCCLSLCESQETDFRDRRSRRNEAFLQQYFNAMILLLNTPQCNCTQVTRYAHKKLAEDNGVAAVCDREQRPAGLELRLHTDLHQLGIQAQVMQAAAAVDEILGAYRLERPWYQCLGRRRGPRRFLDLGWFPQCLQQK